MYYFFSSSRGTFILSNIIFKKIPIYFQQQELWKLLSIFFITFIFLDQHNPTVDDSDAYSPRQSTIKVMAIKIRTIRILVVNCWQSTVEWATSDMGQNDLCGLIGAQNGFRRYFPDIRHRLVFVMTSLKMCFFFNLKKKLQLLCNLD